MSTFPVPSGSHPSPTSPAVPSSTTPNAPDPNETPNYANVRHRKALVATNTVTTKDGLTVRARIDPTLVSSV
jgi:hypothetical protein